MQAIEFEATTFQHTICVPDSVPDGVKLRVILLVNDKATNTGSDENFEISRDLIQNRRPDHLTMKVDDIGIPARDERYER